MTAADELGPPIEMVDVDNWRGRTLHARELDALCKQLGPGFAVVLIDGQLDYVALVRSVVVMVDGRIVGRVQKDRHES